MARAIDGLVTQIGQVPLAELLQEASDIAERHLIDESLKRTQGDGALAAHLLSISTDNFDLRSRYLGIGSSLPTAPVDPKLIH